MNREEIVKAISGKFFLTEAETEEVIKFIVEKAAGRLKKGERIYIRNFGSLHKVRRKKRRVRNVDDGRMMTIPASYTVKFRPAPALLKKIK
jgi:nucleoid DNA-binding protein